MGRLRQTLQTLAGRIVMQDRAAHFEQMLREKAQSAALPGFIRTHFEKVGEKYRLRSNQDGFRRQVLKASAAFIVLWMGEFGRTPRINANRGRDHFPLVTPVVIGGGPIARGQVVGKTSKTGTRIEGTSYFDCLISIDLV